MYKNDQLELLISAYEGNLPQDIAAIISEVQSIYKAYNDDYERYTENYISMMENAFNNFKVTQLIPESKGGTLRAAKPIDDERITALLSDYYNRLFSLRNLKFLSEEKKTVVFVGPTVAEKPLFCET